MVDDVPFPKEAALNFEHLVSHRVQEPPVQEPPVHDPTPTTAQRSNRPEPIPFVPDAPAVPLNPDEITHFLKKELNTPILDELYPRLWLVARKSGSSIDALHRQAIKGRRVVVSEDPNLHLVWDSNKIFVKPIPRCLLNYDFWAEYLSPASIPKHQYIPPSTTKSSSFFAKFDPAVAIGFLRTYAFLIQHRSDLTIANQYQLIPDDLDWTRWCLFIANFRLAKDEDVAIRYHYGQLRISRLHWAVRLFRPRSAMTAWFYEIPHWSTRQYLEHVIAPLAFVFASLSIVLSAMQVVISIPADGLNFSGLQGVDLQTPRRAFWVFSVMLLILSVLMLVLFLTIPSSVLAWQLSWGYKNRNVKKNTPGQIKSSMTNRLRNGPN